MLLQTNETRLSKDGKRIECLSCGKSPKLDKCKRTAAGHLKYFRRVHNCNPPKANRQPKKSMNISSLQNCLYPNPDFIKCTVRCIIEYGFVSTY